MIDADEQDLTWGLDETSTSAGESADPASLTNSEKAALQQVKAGIASGTRDEQFETGQEARRHHSVEADKDRFIAQEGVSSAVAVTREGSPVGPKARGVKSYFNERAERLRRTASQTSQPVEKAGPQELNPETVVKGAEAVLKEARQPEVLTEEQVRDEIERGETAASAEAFLRSQPAQVVEPVLAPATSTIVEEAQSYLNSVRGNEEVRVRSEKQLKENLKEYYTVLKARLEADEQAQHQAAVFNRWVGREDAKRLKLVDFGEGELEVGIANGQDEEIRIVYETYQHSNGRFEPDARLGGTISYLTSAGSLRSEVYVYAPTEKGVERQVVRRGLIAPQTEIIGEDDKEDLSRFLTAIRLYIGQRLGSEKSVKPEEVVRRFRDLTRELKVTPLPPEDRYVLVESDFYRDIGQGEKFGANKNSKQVISFSYQKEVGSGGQPEYLIGFIEPTGKVLATAAKGNFEGRPTYEKQYDFDTNSTALEDDEIQILARLTNYLERYNQAGDKANN